MASWTVPVQVLACLASIFFISLRLLVLQPPSQKGQLNYSHHLIYFISHCSKRFQFFSWKWVLNTYYLKVKIVSSITPIAYQFFILVTYLYWKPTWKKQLEEWKAYFHLQFWSTVYLGAEVMATKVRGSYLFALCRNET